MTTVKLPPSLSPWAQYLSQFSPVLGNSIGALVKRIDRLIGPSETSQHSESDEPDGYDGIARRGSYERLLISEWLLADELPDEFLRRSANSEQSFLELGRTSPIGQKTITALFDCGPTQFGSPRIVQLAFLILLARRADSIGADFRWGVLNQNGNKTLRSGVSSADVAVFLQSRSVKEVTEQDIEQWISTLGADWQTTWIAAGERTLRQIKRSPLACLQIDDVLEPAERSVKIKFTQPGKREFNGNLTLPPEEHCAQLLRNPFAQTYIPDAKRKIQLPTPAGASLLSNGIDSFLWRPDADARWVYTNRAPRHAYGGHVKQRKYESRTHAPILAAAIKVANLPVILVLEHDADTITLDRIGKKVYLPPTTSGALGSWGFPTPLQIALPFELEYFAQKREAPFSACFAAPDGTEAIWTVLEDRLISIPIDGRTQICAELDDSVIGIAARGRQITYAKQTPSGTLLCTRGKGLSPSTQLLPEEVAAIHLGNGGTRELPQFGLIAYQSEMDHSWWLVDSSGSTTIALDDGDQVLGVCGRRVNEPFSSLLVLSANRRELKLVGDKSWLALPTINTDIATACAASNGTIAYITTDGTLTIFWLESQEWLRYFRGGVAARGKVE